MPTQRYTLVVEIQLKRYVGIVFTARIVVKAA